jgi:hypothetical protein
LWSKLILIVYNWTGLASCIRLAVACPVHGNLQNSWPLEFRTWIHHRISKIELIVYYWTFLAKLLGIEVILSHWIILIFSLIWIILVAIFPPLLVKLNHKLSFCVFNNILVDWVVHLPYLFVKLVPIKYLLVFLSLLDKLDSGFRDTYYNFLAVFKRMQNNSRVWHFPIIHNL